MSRRPVAMCCSVLQCVAVKKAGVPSSMAPLYVTSSCSHVLQRVAACCSVLQCVAVCCSKKAECPFQLHRYTSHCPLRMCCNVLHFVAVCFSLQCVALYCSVFQFAMCCILLQCVSVCNHIRHVVLFLRMVD